MLIITDTLALSDIIEAYGITHPYDNFGTDFRDDRKSFGCLWPSIT